MERFDQEKTSHQLNDAELSNRIDAVRQEIIAITDNPTRDMADVEVGRDPESNAQEGALGEGQIMPQEARNLETLRSELKTLEDEEASRKRPVAA